MKKIFLSLLAVAALASCTKSEVLYEQSQEIGFAPSSKNITKAAMTGGLQDTCKLGIWAFWNGVNGTVENSVSDYTKYKDVYLQNAQFINRKDDKNESTVNWGGEGVAYPWPTNGALVFAGYNKPNKGLNLNCEVSYSFLDDDTTTDINESDQMTFKNYVQSTDLAQTFDLCWFGRTTASYNNRATNQAVSITMSHALTWITIKVKGDATTAPETGNKWKVTKATLKQVNTVGEVGTCTITDGTANAEWTSSTPENIIIKAAEQDLTQDAVAYESTTNGLVVIPQAPVQLEIEYKYPVSGVYKDGKSTVYLSLDHPENNKNYKDESGDDITTTIASWESGKHYIYTLVFKANEILVAPSYGTWTTVVDQTVTVE